MSLNDRLKTRLKAQFNPHIMFSLDLTMGIRTTFMPKQVSFVVLKRHVSESHAVNPREPWNRTIHLLHYRLVQQCYPHMI